MANYETNADVTESRIKYMEIINKNMQEDLINQYRNIFRLSDDYFSNDNITWVRYSCGSGSINIHAIPIKSGTNVIKLANEISEIEDVIRSQFRIAGIYHEDFKYYDEELYEVNTIHIKLHHMIAIHLQECTDDKYRMLRLGMFIQQLADKSPLNVSILNLEEIDRG